MAFATTFELALESDWTGSLSSPKLSTVLTPYHHPTLHRRHRSAWTFSQAISATSHWWREVASQGRQIRAGSSDCHGHAHHSQLHMRCSRSMGAGRPPTVVCGEGTKRAVWWVGVGPRLSQLPSVNREWSTRRGAVHRAHVPSSQGPRCRPDFTFVYSCHPPCRATNNSSCSSVFVLRIVQRGVERSINWWWFALG
jgi:hypothetical protein